MSLKSLKMEFPSKHCKNLLILPHPENNYNEKLTGFSIIPLSANFTKWSNTLKQFVGKLPTNCLSVFDHFVGLMLKVLLL